MVAAGRHLGPPPFLAADGAMEAPRRPERVIGIVVEVGIEQGGERRGVQERIDGVGIDVLDGAVRGTARAVPRTAP